jgi:hypothetical protein
MPLIWIVEAEQAAGVFGEAQARLAQAESELGAMMVAWGGVIVGGIAYLFSGSSQQNPPGGWRPDFSPICVPVPGPGGFDEYDDGSGYAVDFDWEGSYDDGGDGGEYPPPA